MNGDRRAVIKAGLAGVAAGPVAAASAKGGKAPSIDIHTHMYPEAYLRTLRSGDDNTRLVDTPTGPQIRYRDAFIARITPPMTDWPGRIRAMDEAGVDIAVISLTAPNVFFGGREGSIAAARAVNDEYADAATRWPERIRWFASLPWDHPEDAVAELRRAAKMGAVGVCLLTNILGRPLTHPDFRPIWREIEAMGLPAFIHPNEPWVDGMGMQSYGLFSSIGFTAETSLCFARMILDGFLEDFPRLALIACHGGGALPYLIARIDKIWATSVTTRKISRPPSSYLRRLLFDTIVYDTETLDFLMQRVGADRLLFGSDYPFQAGDMKGILGRVDALPAAQRDAVRGGNARTLLKL